eukprot:885377-Pyramimonas_sp.AAC.1
MACLPGDSGKAGHELGSIRDVQAVGYDVGDGRAQGGLLLRLAEDLLEHQDLLHLLPHTLLRLLVVLLQPPVHVVQQPLHHHEQYTCIE